MDTDATAPAHGEHTDHGIPHGYSSLTPFLALHDPAGALDFYVGVFGARVVNCLRMGEAVAHAELEFSHGRLQLGAASEAYGTIAPYPDADAVASSLALYCPDVDAVVERAVTAGATLREPVTVFVSGDRFASIRDPFGVRWSIMTRVEDLSDEESERRVLEWATQQG